MAVSAPQPTPSPTRSETHIQTPNMNNTGHQHTLLALSLSPIQRHNPISSYYLNVPCKHTYSDYFNHTINFNI